MRAPHAALVVLLGTVPCLACAQAAPQRAPDTAARAPEGPTGPVLSCVVTGVSDGDTIRCRAGREQLRVRLTGIDAPEMADTAHGLRSRQALARMAPVGDTVRLEADVRARDQYDRVLAYVWRDGVMLNEWMVREGWALPYTVPPNVRYEATFRSAQREARAGKAGLWREDGFACPPEQFRKGACGR